MLMTLLGWFLVFTGVFFFLRPVVLRNRLNKKSYRHVRGVLFLGTLAAAGLFISAGWKMEGGLSKVILVVGIIGVFKAFFFLKHRAAEKIVTWFAGLPLPLFRAVAALQVALGIMVLKSS